MWPQFGQGSPTHTGRISRINWMIFLWINWIILIICAVSRLRSKGACQSMSSASPWRLLACPTTPEWRNTDRTEPETEPTETEPGATPDRPNRGRGALEWASVLGMWLSHLADMHAFVCRHTSLGCGHTSPLSRLCGRACWMREITRIGHIKCGIAEPGNTKYNLNTQNMWN